MEMRRNGFGLEAIRRRYEEDLSSIRESGAPTTFTAGVLEHGCRKQARRLRHALGLSRLSAERAAEEARAVLRELAGSTDDMSHFDAQRALEHLHTQAGPIGTRAGAEISVIARRVADRWAECVAFQITREAQDAEVAATRASRDDATPDDAFSAYDGASLVVDKLHAVPDALAKTRREGREMTPEGALRMVVALENAARSARTAQRVGDRRCTSVVPQAVAAAQYARRSADAARLGKLSAARLRVVLRETWELVAKAWREVDACWRVAARCTLDDGGREPAVA